MFKPLLAATCEDLTKVKLPLMVSNKYDGIRCIVINNVLMSRTLKPIRNSNVQKMFSGYNYYDGELILGDPTDPDCFSNTTSIVMSDSKEAKDVKFYAFDHVQYPDLPFYKRLAKVSESLRVPHVHCSALSEVEQMERCAVSAGYEGIMLRDPHGVYKYGRSTLNQNILSKYKRFLDDEGLLVAVHPQKDNQNPSIKDGTGRSHKSTKKANITFKDTTGSLELKLKTGETLFVGSGLNDGNRQTIWDDQYAYIGKWVKFTYQKCENGLPRFPVFQGFRDADDL